MPGVVQFDRQAPLPWQAIPRAGWSCPSWRETQGAPKWLASGLQPLETGEALSPRPGGLRHGDQLAPNGMLSSVQWHGPRATWDVAPRAGERSQIHPAAGDRWVMPGRHPQPRVGVNATYTRQVR